MATSISTGSGSLDRRLEGGLQSGALLALVADPASQSEAILYTLMEERPTLYVSTVRRAEAVRRDLNRVFGDATTYQVVSVGDEADMGGEMSRRLTGTGGGFSSPVGGDRTLEEVFDLLQSVGEPVNVVLDPVNPLERSPDEQEKYRTVLNELKSRVMETGGLGVVHCIDGGDRPTLRGTTLTVADTVWRLEQQERKSERRYHLTVRKNRGRPIAEDSIELVLGPKVHIDDTRNI